MGYVAAGGVIVAIGIAGRMIWKEFGRYVSDVSPSNFEEEK